MKPYHIDSDLTYKNSISQNSISKHMYFYLDYKHLKALDVLVLAGGYPVRQKGNGSYQSLQQCHFWQFFGIPDSDSTPKEVRRSRSTSA